ncbi:MAG: hypothetical protein ABIO62_00900, partial [Paracoccaceae bacterium]
MPESIKNAERNIAGQASQGASPYRFFPFSSCAVKLQRQGRKESREKMMPRLNAQRTDQRTGQAGFDAGTFSWSDRTADVLLDYP